MSTQALSTKVGIGAVAVAAPGEVPLVGLGIGSCIALCLWDPVSRIAGMAHVMLPESVMARGDVTQPGKYADTALPALVGAMGARGAIAAHLVAVIAGGAQMFSIGTSSPTMAIGRRNEEAVRAACLRAGIPIRGADTGGTTGRTVEIRPDDGAVVVRTLTGGARTL